MKRTLILCLGLVSALACLGASKGTPLPACEDPEPADAFSEKLESLLQAVEGPGFPSVDNLEAWPERSRDIRARLGEILTLAEGDPVRRKAAVQTLIGAEVLTAEAEEAHIFGQGPERGEVRAWARHALKRYATSGVTNRDLRFLNAELITDLQTMWANEAVAPPQRDLPFYQEKATALRELASFRQSPACE